MPVPPVSPHTLYAERFEEAAAQVRNLTRRERNLSAARLSVFAGGVLVPLLAFDTQWYSPWWTALPALIFASLVVVHDRCIRLRKRAQRIRRFFETGILRLEGRWAGQGVQGERFLDPHHPFAADLDLFGPGSLFEFLCTARTSAGEDILAQWLLHPSSPDEIRRRQVAVAELRSRLELRLDLALLADETRAEIDPGRLARWAAAVPVLAPESPRLAAVALVASTLLSGVWLALGHSGWPLVISLLVQALFALLLRNRVVSIIRDASAPDRNLALFACLLGRMEQESFTSPYLQDLSERLRTQGEPPSHRIARLHRLVHLLDARRNQVFAPFSGLLLWGTQCALAIENWRQQSGSVIAHWLQAVAEMEALCSLSGYAFEHPGDPFPEVKDDGSELTVRGIGHPLIDPSVCVRNDLQLGSPTRVLVVSGSNMSGKSTLLRSVGTNVVLAFAGAPVRAEAMTLSPLALGASIRTHDSLQEGTSRFYAEIKRLRQIMDLATGEKTLLFLLDEILHGTNSHDRGIGAEAIVRGFLRRGAIGLVTTHDLALTRVAEVLAPETGNVHFEDQMHEGTMCFDYRMRPGVVTHSNALALMRAVGLEV